MTGRLRFSRAAAVAGVALVAAAVYFLAVTGAAALAHARGGVTAALAMFALPLLSAIAAALLIPARHTRAWAKVMIAKHLFAHRYDYRDEWLRFTGTLGGDGDAPIVERAIRAIADIVDAPAGLLLAAEDDTLSPGGAWCWRGMAAGAGGEVVAMLSGGHIVALDDCRDAPGLPEWLAGNPAAWAVVPLMHFDRLTGAVVLERPPVDRALDWEDFDLLRVAGRQAASTLAEARGRDALAELRRFDEFNRRFAFIMHDIKNLVSQLTLVARNAERHADNPEFRADMIATLNGSTARMNDLLARLSQHNKAKPDAARSIAAGRVVDAVAAAKRPAHPVVIAGDPALPVMADPARFETALSHLVQNAIDASTPFEPVMIAVRAEGGEVLIEIEDRGQGMSEDFVRGELFRPFASTKDGGFGIGAFEARALIAAMGGRLSVVSAPGAGSRFTIALPMGETPKRLAA